MSVIVIIYNYLLNSPF